MAPGRGLATRDAFAAPSRQLRPEVWRAGEASAFASVEATFTPLAFALLAASVLLGGAAAASKRRPHRSVPHAHRPPLVPPRPPLPAPGFYPGQGCSGTSFRDSLSDPATTVWTCFVAP